MASLGLKREWLSAPLIMQSRLYKVKGLEGKEASSERHDHQHRVQMVSLKGDRQANLQAICGSSNMGGQVVDNSCLNLSFRLFGLVGCHQVPLESTKRTSWRSHNISDGLSNGYIS